MNSFEDDFEELPADDFVEDDFQEEPPKETPKKEQKELNWFEKNFTSEGQQQQGLENRNFGKGVLSGLSAGYSELIPGFEVDPEMEKGTAGKFVGSVAPLGYGAKAAAIPFKLAAKAIPQGAKYVNALGNLIGFSASGGLYDALEESAEKTKEKGEFVAPDIETFSTQGAKWLALDLALKSAGLLGRFASSVIKKFRETGVPKDQIVNQIAEKISLTDEKVAEKALSVLEGTPIEAIEKDIALSQKGAPSKTQIIAEEAFDKKVTEKANDLKNRKVEVQDFNKLKEAEQKTPTKLPETAESPYEIAEEATSKELEGEIEQFSQRAENSKALGENIKEDIEIQNKARRDVTDKLYKTAEEGIESKRGRYRKTAKSIVQKLKGLQEGNIKLTPEGYDKAEKQLIDFLHDVGYEPVFDEFGNIKEAVLKEDIYLTKAINIKKRGNDIIDYDLLETGAQDLLKEPFETFRGEIRTNYGPTNSKARRAFEEAEKLYGENAERLKKKKVSATRYTESPESLMRTIKTPSGLADLKEVVSAEQFAQIERELLEHMKTLSEDKARQFYREINPSLSPKARNLAEQLIESKVPAEAPTKRVAQREKLKNTLFDDFAHALETGERPEKALKMWQTKEGQQLVKHFLENNPNKKEIISYLSEQSFKDLYGSVVKENGVIDFKSLNKYLDQAAVLENIRIIGGDEGVQLVKNLETISNNINKNKSILENTIQKGTAEERKKIYNEIEKAGNEILERTKKKNVAPETKEKNVFGETIGNEKGTPKQKERAKERKETLASQREKGKNKLAQKKEEVQLKKDILKEEQKAAEEKEKETISNKLNELTDKIFGLKAKTLFAALGISTGHPVETLAAGAAWQALEFLLKNPEARQSLYKAASQKTPTSFISAIKELEENMD